MEKTLNKNELDVATLYGNLISTYTSLGDYQNALKYAQKTLFSIQKDFPTNNPKVIRLYNNIALLYNSIGDYNKALEYLNKALSVSKNTTEQEYSDNMATIYNNMALIYSSTKNYQKSLEYAIKSLNIRTKINSENYINLSTSYNNIASIHQSLKNFSESLNYHKKSLQIRIDIFGLDHTETAIVYNNIAMLYSAMGEYAKALKYQKKSLNINKKTLGVIHPRVVTGYYNIGWLYSMLKKYKKGFNYSTLAFEKFLHNKNMNFIVLNANQKNTYLQANFMRINSLLYIALTYLNSLKKSNKQRQFILQSTINSWLNYKGSVFDSENTISILYVNTQDKALKEKMDTLINYKRILAKLYQTLPQNNDYKSWQEKIKNIENKITELTTSIASKAESFKEQEGLKSISYTDISTNLKENELYIDYAKGGEFYYIFTLDKYNNISFYQIDVKKSQTIEQLIASFREDIQKLIGSKGTLSIHSKEKLSALYQLLIQEPLSKELKQYSNLIISPDGALRLLPFEALYDTKAQKYLIESKEIRYIPSGKELVRLYKYASKSSNPTPNAAIISNPNFDYVNTANKSVDIGVTPNTNQVNIVKSLFKMHFTPLLGTKIEAENITKILKPTTTITNYQEDRANETNLMRLLSPNILHIATHGFFINDANVPNPMLKSGIALSGANESAKSKEGEGIVTALKLSGLKLKSTDLVVLSACETGVVDINDTDSVSGLGKAFIQAGAKDIVMSLWSVDDNATKDLMIDFYQGIQHNSNYAKALKEAKLKMITQGKHPFFWAGFVLSGL